MKKILHLPAVLIACFVAAVDGASRAVDTFTFRAGRSMEDIAIEEFISPRQFAIPFDLDTGNLVPVPPVLTKDRSLMVFERLFMEPQVYRNQDLSRALEVPLNNVILYPQTNLKPSALTKLEFKIYSLSSGRWKFVYSKEFPVTRQADFFNFSLVPGRYKIKAYIESMFAGTSDIIDAGGDYVGFLHMAKTHTVSFTVLCRDHTSAVRQAQVALYTRTGHCVGTGYTDVSGRTFFSGYPYIFLPENLEEAEGLTIQVINQGQEIYSDTIYILSGTPDTVQIKLTTQAEPLSVLKKKPVTVTGRILVSPDTSAGKKPLRFCQVALYEKEVGFFKPYIPDADLLKLAETTTDTYGRFVFPAIDNNDGLNKFTRDLQVVAILKGDRLSVFNEYLGTRKIYKIRVAYQEDNWPVNGIFNFGDILISPETPDFTVIKIFKLFYDNLYAYTSLRAVSSPKFQIAYPSLKFNILQKHPLQYDSSRDTIKLSRAGGDMIRDNRITSNDIKDFIYKNIRF